MERGLNSYIRERSKYLGIDIVGFTDCKTLEEAGLYLTKRINRGDFTEFEDRKIENRIEPKRQLDSCRSIISVGLSYNYPQEKVDRKIKFKGKLSKSSLGEDYHRVLKGKMEELVIEIKKIEDFEYKIIVDTSPLLDRELARKSGLGYFGKNCSIINDDYGSFIFLGHILTSLDLEINQEISESECGTCRICLEACPTGALKEAYYLNPKRCISYLTQTREEIDEELLEKMGSQIYGCDVCQDVCPKNKGVKTSRNEEFYSLIGSYVDLKEIFDMSNREFKNKYGHMAGSWRGRNTFKRNAIIALGNQEKKEGLELLYRELEVDDERFNHYLDWAIKKIESKG